VKKLVSSLLIVGLLSSGCATIQHPAAPNVQYSSMAQCQQQNPEAPQACEKILHQQATNEAVATTATVVTTLGYIALVIWAIVSLGR